MTSVSGLQDPAQGCTRSNRATTKSPKNNEEVSGDKDVQEGHNKEAETITNILSGVFGVAYLMLWLH